MRLIFTFTIFCSLSVFAQETEPINKVKIYKHLLDEFIAPGTPVVNESFTVLTNYDIDGDFDRWIYSLRPANRMICLSPIMYEQTVISFLRDQGIELDTSTIFHQVGNLRLDSISKYVRHEDLISYKKAPIGSFFDKLFNKKRAVAFSPVFIDDKNQVAIVKLKVLSRRNLVKFNPSQIIILRQENDGWKTLGVIKQKNQMLTQTNN